jgi:hypothetical protein
MVLNCIVVVSGRHLGLLSRELHSNHHDGFPTRSGVVSRLVFSLLGLLVCLALRLGPVDGRDALALRRTKAR